MAINPPSQIDDLPHSIGVPIWVEQVARRFLPQLQSLQPHASGFSGGRVYQAWTPIGCYALKQYPANCSVSRLREIHAMQLYAAGRLKIVPNLCVCHEHREWLRPPVSHGPASQTLLPSGEYWFDCSQWLPGSPISIDAALGDQDQVNEWVAAGAAAIAELHLAIQPLGSHHAPAPAWIERQHRFLELQDQLPAAIAAARRLASERPHSPWQAAADRIEHWRTEGLQATLLALRNGTMTAVPIQWVMRDIHREHMLFQADSVSGLIDFDAARPDTVAVDLARWAGSFIDLGLEKTRIWNSVWRGYQAVRPISACEQQLASAMEETSWHLRLANWMVWVAVEQRTFPGSTTTPDERLRELLRRTHTLS